MNTHQRVAPVLAALFLSISACAQAQPLPSSGGAGQTAAARDYVEIPFRLVKNQMLINVQVNGRGPFTFLVDSGVAGAAIDSDLAAELGIELNDNNAQRIQQFGETLTLYQTSIPRITVGALTVESLQAAALPLTPIGDRLGEPVHGVLGDGFLKSRATRFDHANHTMAFADSLDVFADDIAAADYVAPLVMNASGNMPLVEVKLGDGRTITATIDTGSSLGLEIFTPFVDELGLRDRIRDWKQSEVLGGSLGKATIHEGALDRISIGPMVFTDAPTSITPPRSDPNRQGNIGNELWAGYVLILSYPEKKMIFRKID